MPFPRFLLGSNSQAQVFGKMSFDLIVDGNRLAWTDLSRGCIIQVLGHVLLQKPTDQNQQSSSAMLCLRQVKLLQVIK